MKFGIKQNVKKSVSRIFLKYPQIEKAILYGSRANESFLANSDIDFTIIGEKLDLTTLLKIESELDELLLPYKIDLSIFHMIENEDLVKHINRVGIVFYEK